MYIFLYVGNHNVCTLKNLQRFQNIAKSMTSLVKSCLVSGKGTWAKYHICVPCGAQRVRHTPMSRNI